MNNIAIVLMLSATKAHACGVTADGGLHHHAEVVLLSLGGIAAFAGVVYANVKGFFKGKR